MKAKQIDIEVAENIIRLRRPKRSTVKEQMVEPKMMQNWLDAASSSEVLIEKPN